MTNATYLFEKPNRYFHNSESFWTSMVGLFLLKSSKCNELIIIPTYRYYHYGDMKWEFKEDDSFKVPNNLEFENVVIEGRINPNMFSELNKRIEFPQRLTNLKPDLLVTHKEDGEIKEIIIFEIKTIGTNIHQKGLYEDLLKHLHANGFKASLYFVLSIGHENNADWLLLSEKGEFEKGNNFTIILWEDVLKVISNDTSCGYILGDISKYCTYQKYQLTNK